METIHALDRGPLNTYYVRTSLMKVGKSLINNELHTAEDDLHAPDMDSFDINQFLLCMKLT